MTITVYPFVYYLRFGYEVCLCRTLCASIKISIRVKMFILLWEANVRILIQYDVFSQWDYFIPCTMPITCKSSSASKAINEQSSMWMKPSLK